MNKWKWEYILLLMPVEGLPLPQAQRWHCSPLRWAVTAMIRINFAGVGVIDGGAA